MDLEMGLDAAADVRIITIYRLSPTVLKFLVMTWKMFFGNMTLLFPVMHCGSSVSRDVLCFVRDFVTLRVSPGNGLGAAANVRITIVGRACRKLQSLQVLESWLKNALKNTAIVTCCYA